MIALLWFACSEPGLAPSEPLPLPTGYAGSARCAGCHLPQAAAWSGSHHQLAERPVREDDPPVPGGLVAARVIGVDPLRQVLVTGERGALQVPQIGWDPARAEWFPTVADPRGPGEWGHGTGRGANWNSRCGACHNTGFVKGYDPVADRWSSAAAEVGVGCEGCHGPSAAHAAGGPAPPGVSTSASCAACHALRSELVDASDPASPFLEQFAPVVPDLGDSWWPDGRVRGEVFEWAAFAGSAMGNAGVTCAACHDVHSARLLAEGDALCNRCHGNGPGAAVDHGHHAPGQVGCIDCHMPVTVYMARDPRHDHGFSLPDPLLAQELGTPDACAACHAERPPGWTARAAEGWYGEIGHRGRARALAGARSGDPAALEGVVEMVARDTPRWRATGAAALGAYLHTPGVLERLIALADDPDPLVRFSALGALAPSAGEPRVEKAAEEALRQGPEALRVSAARLLLPPPSPTDPRVAAWARYLAHNADQPVARVESGSAALQRGDPRGLGDLARAADWDPSSPDTLRLYAVGLAGAGRHADAYQILVRATAAGPDDAEAWFARGLTAAQLGDTADAMTSLERATLCDPGFARAWLNLGLLRAKAGNLAAARRAFESGERADPDSPDVGYAHAAVLRDAGDRTGALRLAEALVSRFPQHAPSRALAESLRL